MVVKAAVIGVIALATALAALFGYSRYFQARLAAQHPPTGQFVEVDGARLHFIEKGEGRPVVLIHGASGSLRDFELSILDALAVRYRVIAIDRPGHGHSPRPAMSDIHDPAAQARLIREALRALEVERPILLGHSWGGAVAAAYAVAYGDELGGLLVLSGATHPWRGSPAWYNRLALTPVAGDIFLHALLAPLGQGMIPGGVERNFAPNPVTPDYAARAGVAMLLRPSNFRANAADNIGLSAILERQSRLYDAIRVPTIIMSGDTDRTVSWKLHSRSLHGQIAGSSLEILEGVGHMPHHARPDAVIAAIDSLAAQPSER
jgi:pimeloyl-ACP methyl ester carboxylesterase